MSLYKKWTFYILLNNLVSNTYFIFKKKVLVLNFDIYKYFFFNYSKATIRINQRFISVKNKLTN
jgi:hypothetical protein